MTITEALEKALGYEMRIRDMYAQAAADATVPEARVFFDFLAVDEDRHVAFIEHSMIGARTGKLPNAAAIETSLPADLQAAIARARAAIHAHPDGGKLTALEHALKAEQETSAFYRKLVTELPADSSRAFARLLEIEDGHTAIVKAELDSVTASGYWFDIRVFDMEE